MLNKQQHIDYWINGSNDDLDTAEILLSEKRYLHGLFFCHLTIEKAIKARVINHTGETSPKSHNLIYLSEKANITFDEKTNIFLGILMKYQLQGRYPDYNPIIPDEITIKEYLSQTKELHKWLKETL